MGLIIGPTPWWQSNLVSVCPVGTTLPDGSIIICKAGGTSWIVAPSCTEISQTWNNSTNTLVGDKPNVADWPTLCARMVSCGFNPSDWFVPSYNQLSNPGYVCRSFWCLPSSRCYWSSTEVSAASACGADICVINLSQSSTKSTSRIVRAFRCVTY